MPRRDPAPASCRALVVLVPSHRIGANQDLVDHRCYGGVQVSLFAYDSEFMRGRGILQDSDNLGFRQDLVIVQCEQQRLADREGRYPDDVVG